MRKLSVLLSSLLLALGLSAIFVVPAQAYEPPNADIALILAHTNQARQEQGLPTLALEPHMTAVAQAWSEQQESAGQMSHNVNYSTQIPAGWSAAAENVAYGYAVDAVVQAWMDSPGHRANILGDYDSIGIGVSNGYYTQVFARYGLHSEPVVEPTTPAPPEEPAQEAPATPSVPAPQATDEKTDEAPQEPRAEQHNSAVAAPEEQTLLEEPVQEESKSFSTERADATEQPQPSQQQQELFEAEQQMSSSEGVFEREWLIAGAIVVALALGGAVAALVFVLRKR